MPRILVVEDNEMNRDMLTRRLARKGFETIAAVDGQRGRRDGAHAKPDLILMDMSLPVLDGWEATRRIKADPETRSIPVIALTAHAMAGDRERALEAGCDDYDTKPVEFPSLLAKIEALLAHLSTLHMATLPPISFLSKPCSNRPTKVSTASTWRAAAPF